jgi:hypothetical protein
MTLAGALFLTISLSCVWGLAIFCYRLVLSAPPPSDDADSDAPSEQA